ncbi:MAG TPA: hypothetical protein VJT13_25105 [Xanthobacteraceae bacterium]|nr:hypothetical protein [Xanthobacteraceae bacterium]
MSGFGRIVLLGAIVATVAGIAGLRAQTQLADPKDAPRIFASTCSACHKSPQGLAKSGQVAGFLRQHYTTGPEMSAAMAAYLVAAGSAPAKKDREKAAAAGHSADPASKGKTRKQEATSQPGADGKEPRSLRGKQLQAKSHDDRSADRAAHPAPAPVPPPPASAADAAARQATVLAPAPTPAAPEQHTATPAPEPGPPLMTLDIPLPEMPTAPPADLTQSVFASSPVP